MHWSTQRGRLPRTFSTCQKKLNDGSPVAVKLNPEPDNQQDSKAIAFVCKIEDGEWKRIGYIVREVIDDVQAALDAQKILSVSFDWIRFKTYFKSPGWYAGIKITKNGEWFQQVILSSSNS